MLITDLKTPYALDVARGFFKVFEFPIALNPLEHIWLLWHQPFCPCPPVKDWGLHYYLSHTSSIQVSASRTLPFAIPLRHSFAWCIFMCKAF